MKLSQIRHIAEQDTSASSVASTGTDSGDIATYPFPFSWGPITHVLPSNRFMNTPKRKRRKKLMENMEYTPWDKNDHSASIVMECIGKELQKRLVPYGFSITIGDANVDVVSNSGRIFEFKIIDRYITMAENKTKITFDDQLGISANGPIFMAFPIPKGQSSNAIWKIVESSWWLILKYDVFMEVAPFVDYSDLDQTTLSDICEHFILVPKDKYRGTFDHLGFYKKAFSTEGEIRDDLNEVASLDYFKPINDWKNKFPRFDHIPFHEAMKDVEKFGVKPRQNGTDLYWNDDLRIRFSPNGIGIVEISNANHWYAIHAVPIVPKEYQDEYAKELREFVQKYNKPNSFYGNWHMPDILWKIWKTNAGEPNTNSAIAFHREGLWGIDYTTAGMGRGTSDAALMDAPIIQYRLSVLKEGLSFRSEQVFRGGQTMDIAPCDINVLFHDGFNVEDIVRFIGRFTFSS